MYELQHGMDKLDGGIFMLDLNLTNPVPVNLTFEDNFSEILSREFTPHGMGHWITENGSMILYVINHRGDKDTVYSFRYNPSTRSLKLRKSFEHPELYNLNDLVLVDLDKFYVTRDRHYKSEILKSIENVLGPPLAAVCYVDGTSPEIKVKVAASGFRMPNSIVKSNDDR